MYDHEALKRRARRAQPNEVCGFILDDGTIIDIPNVAGDPTASFAMDQTVFRDCWRQYGPRYAAIWHTHPTGLAHPSSGDFEAMSLPGMYLPHWDYLIVTQFEVTTWDLKRYQPVDDSYWSGFAV